MVFKVSDGDLYGVANISLSIVPIDDNPTILYVNGSGNFAYTEGGPPTELSGLSLVDEDAGNSDVIVNSVTIHIVNGSENEILEVTGSVGSITVSHTIISYVYKLNKYTVYRYWMEDGSWFCRAQHHWQTSSNYYRVLSHTTRSLPLSHLAHSREPSLFLSTVLEGKYTCCAPNINPYFPLTLPDMVFGTSILHSVLQLLPLTPILQ